MEVKEAVKTAKQYIVDVFDGESIVDVALEEVIFDDVSDCWKITVGFSKHMSPRFKPFRNPVLNVLDEPIYDRFYKVVRIDDKSGKIESVLDRILVGHD